MSTIPLIIASLVVAIPICVLIVLLYKIAQHFDGVQHMWFAVASMTLRLELDQCDYECPNWLKDIEYDIEDDDDDETELPPPTGLKLVKLEKDKNGE